MPCQQAVRAPRVQRGQKVVAAAELADYLVAVINLVRAPNQVLLCLVTCIGIYKEINYIPNILYLIYS